ncbi:MAG: DivIVA domain-containing protein [Gemmatimonadales bacterium]
MNEERFELTPVDVRAQEFRRAVRGYAPDDVEDFKERVAEELEKHIRERTQIEERMSNFREQLKAFRERDKAMNEALVAAQQLKDQAQQAAEKEIELIVREAHADADEIVAKARETEVSLNRDIEAAQRQFTAYVASFRRLLERHLAELDALAEHELDGTPPGDGEDSEKEPE